MIVDKKQIRGELNEYSHFYMFKNPDNFLRQVLNYFLRQKLLAKELVKEHGKWKKVDGKLYAFVSKDRKQLHIHINCKDDLWQHLNHWGIYENNLKYKKIKLSTYHPLRTDRLKVQEKFVPFDYQEPIIDYVNESGTRKITNLATGLGKGLITWKSAERLGVRTCVLMLPKYKDKWIEDFKGYCEYGDDTIIVLDTRDKLIKFIDKCERDKDNGDIALVIIPITTIRAYVDWYMSLSSRRQKDEVAPWDMWGVMKIGFRATDEVHEHFHANYMIDLITHMPKTLYLSATLDPSGTFNDKMYRTMFPMSERMGGDIYEPYIRCTAVMYSHWNSEKWHCQMQGRYSHTAYEMNFLRGNRAEHLRTQYFDMIANRLEEKYFKLRKEGQRAIIFFATIEMCSKFVDYLKKKYPNEDIRKYTGEDEYENVQEPDIIVSTTGSAGTAVDIHGLIYNLMAIARRSKQSNLQIIGRLRKLRKWPGQDPEFEYLVANDMQTHLDYHYEKKELFKDRVIAYDEVDSQVVLEK